MANFNVFDVGKMAMSAQMVRMNATASNLANASSLGSTPEEAYHAIRPVFETEYAKGHAGLNSLATVRATDVKALDREPEALFRPDHPQADENGFVYASTVNTEEEMVDMLEASRQYQNVLEAVSTMRTLMSRTMAMGK